MRYAAPIAISVAPLRSHHVRVTVVTIRVSVTNVTIYRVRCRSFAT